MLTHLPANYLRIISRQKQVLPSLISNRDQSDQIQLHRYSRSKRRIGINIERSSRDNMRCNSHRSDIYPGHSIRRTSSGKEKANRRDATRCVGARDFDLRATSRAVRNVGVDDKPRDRCTWVHRSSESRNVRAFVIYHFAKTRDRPRDRSCLWGTR